MLQNTKTFQVLHVFIRNDILILIASILNFFLTGKKYQALEARELLLDSLVVNAN